MSLFSLTGLGLSPRLVSRNPLICARCPRSFLVQQPDSGCARKAIFYPLTSHRTEIKAGAHSSQLPYG
jgi:hypothetical protein